jgi:hypothetical protein
LAARSAPHPVEEVCGVAEPAMASIIASPAPGRHLSDRGMSAETSCWLSSGAAGQEPMPWRFLATTAIVSAYSSLGLNSTT